MALDPNIFPLSKNCLNIQMTFGQLNYSYSVSVAAATFDDSAKSSFPSPAEVNWRSFGTLFLFSTNLFSQSDLHLSS